LKLIKIVYGFIFPAAFLLSSCGQHDSGQTALPQADEKSDSIPGIEKLGFSDTLKLQANENMRFNQELFRVRAGKKIMLILKNTSTKMSASMTHNVVIVKSGIDLADFAEVARKAKNEQYIPSSLDSLIVAHTRLVNAGESDSVEFSIPTPGIHDFFCSFPGHWGTMQGKIVAQ
jgi:azurin